jgi:hypothetical protein
LAPAFRARIAFALSAPKLSAEMLNTLAEYGRAQRSPPIAMRKSCVGGSVGAIEWLIHSYCAA